MTGDQTQPRPKILVADENADVRQHVASLLSERYRVETAGNSAEALAAAKKDLPDMILGDLTMQAPDGLQLLQAVRREPLLHPIPAIILSSRADEASRVEATEAGADDYLITPFDDRELLARIAAHLKRSSTRRDVHFALAQQRRVYEAILTNTPDFAYVFDLNHRFIYANEGLLKMWGRTWNEAIGKTCLELGYEPWHAEKHDQEIEQVIATRQPIRSEVPFTGTTGRRMYDYIFVPVFGDDGQVEAVAGTTRDITDRKQSEEVQSLLAAVVESADDAIISKSLDGIITSWNIGAQQIFGYTAEQIIGQSVTTLFPPELVHEEASIQERIRRGERIEHYQTERVHKNGERIFVSLSVSPVKNRNGQIIGAAKIARDITARKQQEQEREQLLDSERSARAEAERAGRMKDEFLATLSHELRTPLNAILGYATLMKMAPLSPEELQEAADTIERNAKSQAQLIEDLLDMNRIVSGKIRLTISQVDLPSVVEESLKTVLHAAHAKDVRIQKLVEPIVGPVRGDAGRIQQIIWNLLSNAIKFTPKGGKVQIIVHQNVSNVEIRVSDTGQGIPAEFLPHVFDRFRQADASTTRKHGGLGLGLAIVRHLVELHGGTIQASSPGEGQGATFVVTFPIAVVAQPRETDDRLKYASLESDLVLGDIELQGVRVLVVDDESDSTRLVERVLREFNAEVATASSANEGFMLLSERPFHVLVSDIGMPEEDGYQFIRRVRSTEGHENRAIPAVALTAFARSEDRRRAAMAGFQTHLAKPVEAGELIAVVASLAGRAGR